MNGLKCAGRSCYWVVMIALFVFSVAPVVTQAQQPKKPLDTPANSQSDEPSAEHQNPKNKPDSPTLPAKAEDPTFNKLVNKSSHKSTRNSKKDDYGAYTSESLRLEASVEESNRRMARSAENQTTWIALGTFLLFITLILTIRANEAAREAVKVARDNERAWFAPIEITFIPVSDSFVDGEHVDNTFAIQLRWMNAGRSLAKKITGGVFCSIQEISDSSVPRFKRPVEAPKVGAGICAPGITQTVREPFMASADFHAFIEGEKCVFVYAWSYYVDAASGKNCFTEVTFRCEFVGEVGRDGAFRPLISNTLTGPQNNAT